MSDRTQISTHFRACNLCEAICGLAIEVDGSEIIAIRGDKDDPFSRGHICPKAVALQDIHKDPERLRQPMRRQSGGWQPIAWDEALDEVADRLRSVQKAHGRDALAVYLGNPNVHNWGSLLFAPALIRCLGTHNRYSATSVDQLPHHVAATLMFGHKLLLPIPDIDRTSHLLILGANPVVSNGSMMTAPGFKRRLEELQARGGRLIVVDPRRTETARMADEHFFIRPGTDAYLLMALLHVIFHEGLENPGRLENIVESIDALRQATAEFSPESVTTITGIEAEALRRMARDFVAAQSAVCYGRMGVSTQEFGGLCQWLVNAINIVTGNLDRPGGAMFSRPAVDLVSNTAPGRLGHRHSRVRGLPEFGGEFPVAALAEEILTPGSGQVRALMTIAGNPVLSTPNGVEVERAIADLDFMVAIDFYVNETTRYAEIILPPTSALEHDHYDLVFNLLAVRNVARYSPAIFEPVPEARHDWQILEELRQRLDGDSPLLRFKRRLNAVLGPRRILDFGLRSGPYGAGFRPFADGMNLDRLEKQAHGIDLGPLVPCLPDRLRTMDRKIDLGPVVFLDDLERLREKIGHLPDDERLLLIGRRHLRSNNSWMHRFPRLTRGRDRCTLMMNSGDAAPIGLDHGDRVVVISRTGRVEAALEINDDMAPGVVSLPHGWGRRWAGSGEDRSVASANDLTDNLVVDELCGNAVLNGVPVRVEAAD